MNSRNWRIAYLGVATAVLATAVAAMTGCQNESNEGNATNMNNRTEDYHIAEFGENTYFFTPEDDSAEVATILEEIWQKQEANQFGKDRYQIYFAPGEYDERIETKVGFYTQVSGLGALPTDTKLPSLMVDARWDSVDGNNRATCNFWRGVENLYIGSNTKWAVSQATFMRRVAVDGALYLHDEYGWASGGFLANSHVKLMIDGGSQQQWLSRNNQFKMWNDDNWNLVFSGDTPGCDPEATWPAKAYTSVESTKSMREKPYLTYEEEAFYVHVPKLREESQGPDWTMDFEMGQAVQTGEEDRIPLDAFYIAKPEDTADLLNEQLNAGKHILFTPGIYKLDKALEVREGRILLGTGLASLVPTDGNACIVTDDNPGNTIAGLLFDAGEVESELLVDFGGLVEEETVEEKKQEVDAGSNKPLLADVFFRVGGTPTANPTNVKSCLKISINNTLGDNFWVWRADHGDQVAWNRNTADHGLIVDGDNVQIYALMVEHFQKEQTIWNGDNGYILMYQSELPYDVPNQSEWVRTDVGRNGYPSICVSDGVSTFEGVGIGIYSFHRDAAVEEYNVMEVPDKDGVKVHHICAIMITGNPGISHVLNDVGAPAMTGGAKSIIIDYENGVWK